MGLAADIGPKRHNSAGDQPDTGDRQPMSHAALGLAANSRESPESLQKLFFLVPCF
jgi:hypothetical protein